MNRTSAPARNRPERTGLAKRQDKPNVIELSKGVEKMKTFDVNKIEMAPNPHGVDVRKIYNNEMIQVAQVTLNPGEKLKKHTTPGDVLFYSLEGIGIVEIGDEKKEVGPDTLIESPANIPHCWYNESKDRVRFLIIKL
jgi:quercetin dioxygenase-like cupin family protein